MITKARRPTDAAKGLKYRTKSTNDAAITTQPITPANAAAGKYGAKCREWSIIPKGAKIGLYGKCFANSGKLSYICRK